MNYHKIRVAKFILPLSIILLLTFSCEKSNIYIEGTAGDLLGSWIKPVYNDTIITYRRASHLVEGITGITFYDDGSLIERKNAGWCGTPPITLADFNGHWLAGDSIIDLTVDFWGGTTMVKWKIISLTETELSFYIISQEAIIED